MINKNIKTQLEDYISEHEAKKLLKRSSTWFWELRKAGFPYSKLKGETYYRKSDFVKYLELNFSDNK
ncbi:helix-turn-helix domain-containing protein [Bacteroidia bacterium]|nr:helix-turn-helix domain-containing protein [Bacteroidia bacterium]